MFENENGVLGFSNEGVKCRGRAESFLEKMSTDITSSKSPISAQIPLHETVDATTRARAGGLAAHGCLQQQIADILMLSLEQVIAVEATIEYKTKYAEVADEVIQRQIDAAEGWDVVEQKALTQIIQTLEFNRDPKYALFAAQSANRAQRRKPVTQPKVIDAQHQTTVNNVIVLNMNKGYMTKVASGENVATIDITPKAMPEVRKITDLPSPKSVDELLSPVRNEKKRMMNELEHAFEVAGVIFDSDDGE